MSRFDEDEDVDDVGPASGKTGHARQRSPYQGLPARSSAGGPRDITAPALLVGGIVLVLGIGGMAAFRMAGLNDSSNGEAAEGELSPAESASNTQDPDNEPDDTIQIPEIEMPEGGGDFQKAGRPGPRPRTTSDTKVTTPSDSDSDSAANNNATISPVIIPDADAAIRMSTVDYGQTNPFADIATINVVGKDRSRPLLAQLNNVYLHIRKLPEDTRGAVTEAIQTGVQTGLERCRLTPSKVSGEPVMVIELSVLQNKILMTASLIDREQSDFLLMWQKSAQIGAVTDRALQQGILNSSLTKEADNFFVELRSILVDVRRQLGVQ